MPPAPEGGDRSDARDARFAQCSRFSPALRQARKALSSEGETIGTPELVKAACAEGQVVFYTAQSDADERAIIAPFVQQFPCVNVSVISAVTGRLYERIATEATAGKTQGDVAIVTDEALTQQLIDAKLARPWTPPMSANYPRERQGRRLVVRGVGLADVSLLQYRPRQGGRGAEELEGCARSEMEGKIASSPISIGGTAWLQYAFLLDHFGADYLKGFVAQEPKLFTAYNPAVLAVARGEELIGVGAAVESNTRRASARARPLKPVYPPEGLPYTNYPMVQLAGAPHPACGRALRQLVSLEARAIPAREGARRLFGARGCCARPGNPPLAETKPWNPGHEAIIKRHDEVIEEINRVFSRGIEIVT